MNQQGAKACSASISTMQNSEQAAGAGMDRCRCRSAHRAMGGLLMLVGRC